MNKDRKPAVAAAVILLFCCVVSALGAYLETGEGEQPRTPGVRPRPTERNALVELVDQIAVCSGAHYGGLTVFPVALRRVLDPYVYGTLDESVAAGVLLVSEVGEGTVPRVIVQNLSGRHIFLMAGEVLGGGKQNRALADDVLVPPHSGKIAVPVRCVERGRWSGVSKRFGAGGIIVNFGLRRKTQMGASQQEVWREVSDQIRSYGAAAGREDFQSAAKSPAVQQKLAEYRQAIFRAIPRQAVGVVVARAGRIVGADIFANAAPFRKLRQKVLDSYALDCLAGAVRKGPPSSRNEALRFLHRVYGCRLRYVNTPGTGQLARVTGPVEGSVILRRGAAVHVSLFPAPIIRPLPMR